MSSQFLPHSKANPELRSLYQIALLPPSFSLRDYFDRTMSILSQFFHVGYAALVLMDENQNDLKVEAQYGIAVEDPPLEGSGEREAIGEVIRSCSPRIIHVLDPKPHENRGWEGRSPDRVSPPLLCVPLMAENKAFGALAINPLFNNREDFEEDLQFLSVLSALLAPAVKHHHSKIKGALVESKRSDASSPVLEEILEERLNEFLRKVDPYVESKSRTGLLRDVVSLVEKILIKSAMERVNHVQTSAALLLGINRNTLRAKLKELKIKPRQNGRPLR